MDFIWTIATPVIAIFIMRKIFKTLGFGNLFNPMEAMALATAGGGKLAGSSAAQTIGAQLGSGVKDTKHGLQKLGDRHLPKYDENGKQIRRYNPKGNGLSTFGKLYRNQKAIKNGSSVDPLEGTTAGFIASKLTGRKRKTNEESEETQTTGPIAGVAPGLGLPVPEQDPALAGSEVPPDVLGYMEDTLKGLGVREIDENKPEIEALLEAIADKLDPAQTAGLLASLDNAALAEVDRSGGSLSFEEAALNVLGASMLELGSAYRPDSAIGSLVSQEHADEIRKGYAENSGIAEHRVAVSSVSGVPMPAAFGDNPILAIASPEERRFTFDHPIAHYPPELTALRPGESEGERAARLETIMLTNGHMDTDGRTVSMIAQLGLDNLSLSELDSELEKVARGFESSIASTLGNLQISEQSVRISEAYSASVADDLQNPAKTVALAQGHLDDVRSVETRPDEIASAVAAALSGITIQTAPSDVRAVLDMARQGLGDLGDISLLATVGNLAANGDPGQYREGTAAMQAAQQSLIDSLQNTFDGLDDRFEKFVTAASAGKGHSTELNSLIRQMTQALENQVEQVKEQTRATTKALEETISNSAHLGASAGSGSARGSSYASGAGAPL